MATPQSNPAIAASNARRSVPGPTEAFSRYIEEARFEDLPSDVVVKCKHFVMETIAAQIHGASCALGRTMAETLRDGDKTAPMIGTWWRSSLRSAALFNTAIADTNDSGGGAPLAIVHHTKNVVPTALTLGAVLGSNGRDLLTAIAVANECYIRFDKAIGYAHIARGHYNDGSVGALGAAMTAAKLYGLDTMGIRSAIGNAGMWAPATVGGNDMYRSAGRPLAMGMAAANGILAAEMTRVGVTGPLDILECEGGFADALAGVPVESDIARDLGREWHLMGNYHKPFVGCRCTCVPRQGVRALREKHEISPDEIERVECRLPEAYNIVMGHHAELGGNIVEHSCSNSFLLANAIMYDDLGPGCLSEERIADAKLHELALKIELVRDEEIERALEDGKSEALWMGSMLITMKNGEQYHYASDHQKGDPERWPMTEEELLQKLRDYASAQLDAKSIERLADCVLSLETLENTEDLLALAS